MRSTRETFESTGRFCIGLISVKTTRISNRAISRSSFRLGQRGRSMIYGFPACNGKDGGIKIASEQYQVETTPQGAERSVSQAEIDDMYERCVNPCLPGVGRNCIKTAVCLYTMTPDSGFVLDFMPGSSKTIVCSPCSGHGFKHSAAVGECVGELARDGKTTLNIEPLRFDRRALAKYCDGVRTFRCALGAMQGIAR